MANYPKPSVTSPARWARGWPRLAAGCRAREPRIHSALADHLALDCSHIEPARLDLGGLSVANLHSRRSALVGAVEGSVARSPSYLRLGHPVRSPLSGVRSDGIAGQSRRALGCLVELAAGVRLVLHYDFVLACFSSASRMNGMVSRRWAASDASSSWSRISNSECRSRGMRFNRYSDA